MKVSEAIDIAQPYSRCPHRRLAAYAEALQKLDDQRIEGDIVECGVWRGGGVILARLLSPDRIVWLYDTFTGMANRSEFDHKPNNRRMVSEGKCAVSVLEVTTNLDATNTLKSEMLRIVAGKVEDTLLIKDHVPDQIALLHLDTDWYYSTSIELKILWPRLVLNGIMIIDDYGHWFGCRKAVDEYFASTKHNHIVIDETAIMMMKS